MAGIVSMTQADHQSEGIRRAYAHQIGALAGIDRESEVGRAITAAFEAVPRERFVGPPPWRIIAPEEQHQSCSENLEDIYKDVLVCLDLEKGLNNGQPSLHALCLSALAPRQGERCVHVGSGTGYYTALLALLVGESGQVDAFEIDSELAARAASNLKGFGWVQTHARSGAGAPLPECDVLYVSAASAEPLGVWLDALRNGGRLLFPLEPEGEGGQMLLVTKHAEGCYRASFIGGVQFTSCIGAQDPEATRTLIAAFKHGNSKGVRALYRNDAPDESCWCAGKGWWLSTGQVDVSRTCSSLRAFFILVSRSSG